jgi:hypothetical protein
MDIEQPAILKVAATHRRPADPGKEYLFNATLGKHCAYVETRRSTPPRVDRKNAINDNFANRTPVRAKTRVGMIGSNSMR